MADYDLRCILCLHGPHLNKKCTHRDEGHFQICECETFLRSDIQAARALTNLNNLLVDIIHYGFPEIEQRILAGKKLDLENLQKETENADSTAPDQQP